MSTVTFKAGPKTKLKKRLLESAWVAAWPVTTVSRALYQAGMYLEFLKDWAAYPSPEWFNHELDLALFEQWRRPHFFERGVYASEVVTGKRVLDLCCGDGSVSALFVSPLAKSVLAVDFDPKAIHFAQKKWAKLSNLNFQVSDIRDLRLPKASFDVCLWEAAIEHFTPAEMDKIMGSVQELLVPGGVLHGHTIKKGVELGHHDHEHEFDSLEELKEFFSKYFTHVQLWERSHSDRVNYYFRCSSQPLPERA